MCNPIQLCIMVCLITMTKLDCLRFTRLASTTRSWPTTRWTGESKPNLT